MTRRCTQRSCRREFVIGRTTPVRCPYCGHAYPRVPADSTARPIPFGYAVEVDPQGRTGMQMRSLLLRELPEGQQRSLWPSLLEQTFRIDGELSLLQARDLYRRLCRAGVSARVIPGRELTRSREPVIRIRRR